MKITILMTILALLASAANLRAAEEALIKTDLVRENISDKVFYVVDKEKKFTIDQISINTTLQWEQSKRKSLNLGFAPGVYWFRVTVDNQTDKPIEWYLELT